MLARREYIRQPEELAALLCPVIARNEAEQELFYTVFDQYLRFDVEVFQKKVLETGGLPEEIGEDSSAISEEGEDASWLWGWVLLPLAVLLFGFVLWMAATPPMEVSFTHLLLSVSEWEIR